jgi:hypothetical protein
VTTQIFEVVGAVVVAVVAVASAAAYLSSKYRKAACTERELYIQTLKESRDEAQAQCERAEECNRGLAEKNRLLEDRLAAVEAKVCVLQDLVLRQCRHAEKDPVTGGCRFCGRDLWYGQKNMEGA